MSEPFVWVTGASSGLGKELTENLLSENLNVLATARREITLSSETKSRRLVFPSDIANSDSTVVNLRENRIRDVN